MVVRFFVAYLYTFIILREYFKIFYKIGWNSMFDGYILLILVLIILLSIVTIYNIICFIGVIIRSGKYKDLDDDGIKQAIQNENFTLNFWWAIIKRGIKKSGSSKEKLKKSTKIINIINSIATNLLLKIIILLAALLIVFYSMSYIMKAASSIFVVIADECTCFVQCSGDSTDDSKSPYELVFGPTKWNNLKKIYVKYATAEEYEAFEAYTTGKEIGYWCITHINEEVVEQFKKDCLDRSIVKLDGYNVSTMTNDQLSDQFKKLMKDYKENGRGAECKVCNDYSSKLVYLICGGIHKYVAPWSFQSISDETGELDLGNIVFVGDSRTIDMFYDSDDKIWGEEHDGIEVYAKHGGGFSWLEEVYAGGGIGDDTNTLVTWMGANDNGDTSQYESFYQAAMDAGLRVIICTVGPTDDNYLEEGDKTNYSNSKMTQYNDSIKDWANNNGVTVIDVYSFIESTSTIQIDQADGIHYYPRPTTEIWDYILGRIKALTGSTKPPTGGTVMGNATGQYAVQLDDGMYYWYHQGSDKCVNCDEWSSRTWGNSGTEKNFNSNGCAVYSLACIVSNLYGGEITPTVLMNDFGVGTSSGTKYVTSSSSVFSGVEISRFAAMDVVKNKYKLEYSSLKVGSSTTAEQIQYIDDILSKGGVVWSHWIDANCDWCSNGTKHFMGIRKSDGSNYYCFTSTSSKKKGGGRQGAIDTMNMPLSKQAVVDGLEQGGNVLIGIWNPNASAGGGGGSASITPAINGNTITFPAIGSNVQYVEINNKSNSGTLPRASQDTYSMEFAFQYAKTQTTWPIIAKRAKKLEPYLTNANSNGALIAKVNGTDYYVGCSPISGFGSLGDIIKFNFNDGTSMQLIMIDAKSSDDAAGTGSTGQCNTPYCHGVLNGSTIKLSAIEIWVGGTSTKKASGWNLWSNKTVKSAEIVAHTNIFD